MTCQIEISNEMDSEPEALAAALKKANQYEATADHILISCHARVPQDAPAYKHPGWLEYSIFIQFSNGSKLFLMMVQRNIGQQFEFHS